MTERENKNNRSVNEEIELYKNSLKEVFDNYSNPDGSEDRVEISILRHSARLIQKVEKELEQQIAEIERLQKKVEELSDALYLINRQKAEIEQWKEEANKYQNLWCIAVDDMGTVKSEAVKEFAERLKKHSRKMQSSDFSGDFWDAAVLVEDIETTVKEIIREDNA